MPGLALQQGGGEPAHHSLWPTSAGGHEPCSELSLLCVCRSAPDPSLPLPQAHQAPWLARPGQQPDGMSQLGPLLARAQLSLLGGNRAT